MLRRVYHPVSGVTLEGRKWRGGREGGRKGEWEERDRGMEGGEGGMEGGEGGMEGGDRGMERGERGRGSRRKDKEEGAGAGEREREIVV